MIRLSYSLNYTYVLTYNIYCELCYIQPWWVLIQFYNFNLCWFFVTL